jgi:molybdenum cofactor biosynthesis enzyme MoaA
MGFKWLDFKITNRCNNKCIYCGHQDPPFASEIVPGERIRKSLYDALELGFTHFALLGGEPSLRENFSQIVKPLQDSSHTKAESIMVITNMLRFNEEMYRSIFCTNSKHAQVVASIDNLKEPNYKNQSIPLLLTNVDRIKEILKEYDGFGRREIHVHSVISRENFKDIISHVEFFKLRDIEVSLALVEPFEIVEKPTKYNQFTQGEIGLVLEQLNKLEDIKILNWPNTVLREYIERYDELNDNPYDECSAGIKHVIIDADGSVYPCLTNAYSRQLKYGNIVEEDLINIYKRLDGFDCGKHFQQTCWDHFLWSKLDAIKG